jgi:hypothetical protein
MTPLLVASAVASWLTGSPIPPWPAARRQSSAPKVTRCSRWCSLFQWQWRWPLAPRPHRPPSPSLASSARRTAPVRSRHPDSAIRHRRRSHHWPGRAGGAAACGYRRAQLHPDRRRRPCRSRNRPPLRPVPGGEHAVARRRQLLFSGRAGPAEGIVAASAQRRGGHLALRARRDQSPPHSLLAGAGLPGRLGGCLGRRLRPRASWSCSTPSPCSSASSPGSPRWPGSPSVTGGLAWLRSTLQERSRLPHPAGQRRPWIPAAVHRSYRRDRRRPLRPVGQSRPPSRRRRSRRPSRRRR